MNRVIMNIGIMKYILNLKDIFQNQNIKSLQLILSRGFMNRMNMNIGIIIYISKSKYKDTSLYLIKRFHEPRDYEYWNYMIYFKFKI